MAAFGALMLLASLGSGSALPGALPDVNIGTGTGFALANDGSYACDGVNLFVRIAYLPDNHAVVGYSWVGQIPSCLHNGGSTSLGTVSYNLAQVPPVSFEYACNGNPQSGLDCGNGVIRVGPNGGPGSQVWMTASTSAERFFGIFSPVA